MTDTAPRNREDDRIEAELERWAFRDGPLVTDADIAEMRCDRPGKTFRASRTADDFYGDPSAEDDLDREMHWRERDRWL